MIATDMFRRRLMGAEGGDSGYITAVFDVLDISGPTQILGISYSKDRYDLRQIKSMKIDGIDVEPVHEYQFSTTGLHTVVLTMVRKFTDMEILFIGCTYLDSVDLRNVDTSNVINMIAPFTGKTSADKVNLREILGLDTISYRNVELMRSFFGWCDITELDFGRQDLSSVTDMTALVGSAQQLTSLKILGPVNPEAVVTDMFRFVRTAGTFYYNPAYNYQHIIAQLPATWMAVPVIS